MNTSTFPLEWSTRRPSFGLRINWLPAIVLLLSDLLSWPAIFLTLSLLRLAIIGAPGEIEWHVLLVPAVVTVIVLRSAGGYDCKNSMHTGAYAVEHLFSLAIALVISALMLYGFVTFNDLVKPSRLILVVSFLPFATYALIVRRWLAQALRNRRSQHNFLLIADSKTAQSFHQEYRNQRMLQELKIHSGNGESPRDTVFSKADPGFSDLNDALNLIGPETDGLIIGIPPSQIDPKPAELLAYVHFRHIPVYTLESFYESQWKQVPVQCIDSWWAFARESVLARNSIYDQVKRLCDLLAAFVALLVLFPFLLIVGVLIKLESSGPAIYRQPRIGRDGRLFTILKFRTMRVGSDVGCIYTAKRDSRITRLGYFLRHTRIDEFPQLWNVLRGEMSVIGPRAEWVRCVERYQCDIPFYNYRHFVRPGITGWAQVNYPYGENEADALEKLKFDLYYIRHCSLSLDIAIILKTFQIVLLAKGR
jgi:exopolysaccharide biosynthesis polyprenyl glycosylphosphotransferase